MTESFIVMLIVASIAIGFGVFMYFALLDGMRDNPCLDEIDKAQERLDLEERRFRVAEQQPDRRLFEQ